MTSNQLNAGAASFTPPGSAAVGPPPPTMQDSFTEYAEMVDNIEQELDTSPMGGGAGAGPPPAASTSALPSHMVKHAPEFWFPESRDCSCCKGFKHGCQCAASSGGICSVCSTGPPPPSSSLQAAAPGRGPPPQHHASGGGGRGRPICKFFQSPGGCRFGDSCRFLHA